MKKQQLNEIKRMQKLAGLLNENEKKSESFYVNKMRKDAKKFGYVEIKDKNKFAEYNPPEEGIEEIALFVDPADVNKETFVAIYKDERGDLNVGYYYWGGPSGNDRIEDWDENDWIKMIDDEDDEYDEYDEDDLN